MENKKVKEQPYDIQREIEKLYKDSGVKPNGNENDFWGDEEIGCGVGLFCILAICAIPFLLKLIDWLELKFST